MNSFETPPPEDPKEVAERARQQQAMQHYIQYLNSEQRQNELHREALRTTSNEPQGEQND